MLGGQSNHQKTHSRGAAGGGIKQYSHRNKMLVQNNHGAQSANSAGFAPFSFSDAGGVELGVLNDTVNQMSIDQAVLEEAPLPESMEKKRSARSNGN